MFVKFEKKNKRQFKALAIFNKEKGVIRLNCESRDMLMNKCRPYMSDYVEIYFDKDRRVILLQAKAVKTEHSSKIVKNICAGNQMSISCKAMFRDFNITEDGTFNVEIYNGNQSEFFGKSIIIKLK